MKEELIRVFVAIEVPGEVKKELSEVLAQLERLPFSIKWVELKNLHFTLGFLGYVEKDKLDSLYQAIGKGTAEIPPFVVKPSRVVCFPSFNRPRVIVLGLRGEVFLLEKLQKQIEKSLLEAGFRPKVTRPHLTLGRVRPQVKTFDSRRLGRKLMDFSFEFQKEIGVSSVTVFKSDLFPQGPVYTKLKEFTLSQTRTL